MDADVLEKRIEREKLARGQAEELLESKSRELFTLNKMLRSTADQLSLQTSQLNIILDNTLAGIILVGSDNHIIRANRYAEKALGFEPETLFGSNIQDFVKITAEQCSDIISKQCSVSNEPVYDELIAHNKIGNAFPIELSISEADIKGIKHTVWIFRDITQRKIQEEERKKLEDELRQALKLEALGTLASGIAHEINTPIQFVGDNLHFLQDGFQSISSLLSRDTNDPLEKEEIEDLRFLLEEIPQAILQSMDGIKRVSEIVTSVREFSHPGTKDKVMTDINQAIESTTTISTNQWKYVADIKTEFSEDLPEVCCVPGEINQVILNLIVNAAQAIEEKGASEKGMIHITTDHIDGQAQIRIRDTGCGIPEKCKDQVFDPFFTTKEVGKGTGQGLALAHNIIVTKHGGKLYFETEPGEGTTFVIMLPCEAKDSSSRAA